MAPEATKAQEFEPNEPCAFAQAESATSLPVSITGSLDSSASLPDVDFFRFLGNPGDVIQVDLEGASTGAGSLGDPFLGWFDTDCLLQAINDDGGVGLNSRLAVSVPAEGEFVLGVTQCCDHEFLGGGIGSYLLTLDILTTAGSIAGVLEDAETSLPLPGDAPPFSFAYLYQCSGFDCSSFMNSTSAGSAGEFVFTTKFDGAPLPTGTFQVHAFAQGYQSLVTDPFEVATDEHLDLGPLQLNPVPVIGSVTGRLVDALDGAPLPGTSPPFAAAILARCEEFGCFGINYIGADEAGVFRIDGAIHQVSAGEYLVIGLADGYRPAESDRFTIERNEHLDVGDIRLTPVPIRIGDVHTCEIAEGRVCRYGADISVRVAKRLRVEAWSIAQFIPISEPGSASQFQVGRLGTANPMPQQINLKAREMRTLQFELPVPAAVPDSFLLCASLFIGQVPNAQFNLLVERPLFCAFKQAGELRVLSEKETREALRRHRQPAVAGG